MKQYFAMIAQGLLWVHWGEILDDDYACTAMALTDRGVSEFETRFWPKGASRSVERSLAKGALRYKGRTSREYPKMLLGRLISTVVLV